MNEKDFVTRLREIFEMDKELTNKSFIDLFKSHTELLKLILDLKILPSEPVLSLHDPLKFEIYDQEGLYMYTIDTTPHYNLNQKIKKELKLDDYYL
jgi:hypothetical protein